MIKSNELRIGNYVKDAVSGEWMVVDELGENVGAVLLNRDKYPLPDGWKMDYIHLTSEVFQKVGFECTSKGFYYRLNFPVTVKLTGGNWLVKSKSHDPLTSVKYLHQLQNLYYSLTGEELPVNFKELTYQ